jgi:hypothetical protein
LGTQFDRFYFPVITSNAYVLLSMWFWPWSCWQVEPWYPLIKSVWFRECGNTDAHDSWGWTGFLVPWDTVSILSSSHHTLRRFKLACIEKPKGEDGHETIQRKRIHMIPASSASCFPNNGLLPTSTTWEIGARIPSRALPKSLTY